MSTGQDCFWTVAEVAAYLRVPVETLYTWRKRHYGLKAASSPRNTERSLVAPMHSVGTARRRVSTSLVISRGSTTRLLPQLRT